MICLRQEIETYLSLDWVNTNNKEQNFQGRLYAYFLHLEQFGYVVEMETSRNDDHIDIRNNGYNDWAKTEMDIFIYKKDLSEKYAAELKWFYDPGFHYFDHIEEYKLDAEFAKQLVEHGGVTESCSVVIINSKGLSSPKNTRKNYSELMAFEHKENSHNSSIIVDGKSVPFVWKDLHNKISTEDKCYYYILSYHK